MKGAILSTVFCSLFFVLEAQGSRLDSLESLLQQHAVQDTIRVNLLNETADKLRRTDLDKALQYAQEAGELADKLNFVKGKAESLKLIGIYYWSKSDYSQALEYYQKALQRFEELDDKSAISSGLNGIGSIYYLRDNYPKAIEYYQKALQLFEEIGDESGASRGLFNIGNVYYLQSDYPKSLEYYHKALQLFEELGDKSGISNSLDGLGNIYYFQGEYSKSLEYYQRALQLRQGLDDKSRIPSNLTNIGLIYNEQGNDSKALEYYQKARQLSEELGDKRGVSGSLNSIGLIYNEQGNYAKALEYYQKALQLRQGLDYKWGICINYKYIGAVYLQTNQYDQALAYSLKAFELAKKLELLSALKSTNKQLSKIYAATSNYQKAYEHHVAYKQLSDSIYNEENVKKITALEYEYKYEKERQAAELEQAKKDALKAAEAKRQEVIRNSFIVGFVLVFILALVILRSLVQKGVAHRKVEKAHQETQKAFEKLQKAQSSLIQAEKQAILNVVMSSMAHEINNAMNTVKGSADILPSLTDEALEFFAGYGQLNAEEKVQVDQELAELKESIQALTYEIQSGSNRTLAVLNTLQKFSRRSMGGAAYADLSSCCESVIQVAQYLFMGRISLETSLSADLPKVYCDLAKVNQLLLSLLLNATEAIHGEGIVKVSTYRYSPEYIALSVSDSGPGVPEESQERMFQPFYTTKQKSNGIGLFLARESMEEIGGRIFLDTQQSASTFVCLFPDPSKNLE